ncbi:MAG TPA: hypothetical protein VKV37_03240 [Ktedonobacteraceae bacterium]|jgi:hypothetical protein|nr:hypothetical protein [Ktedonobacteraceae bacterium]
MAGIADPFAYSDPNSALTPRELKQLEDWGFLRDYRRHRDELIRLAKRVYTATCRWVIAFPNRDTVYWNYRKALSNTDLYIEQIVGKKDHLSTSLYDYYANLLAKYVLLMDVDEVTSAPCP